MLKKIVICVLLFLCIAIVGCQDNSLEAKSKKTKIETSLPAGLEISVEGLPEIDSISAQSEAYKQWFSSIESAVLYLDGTTQKISPTDERLLRLINFIAQSINERSHKYMTGLVEADEIALWYTYEPMLEINLIEDGSQAISDQKLLIWGNSFLAIKNPMGYEWCEHPIAGRYWPYASFFSPNSELGSSNDQLYLEESGRKPWLDLLVYVGFVEDRLTIKSQTPN